MKAAPIDFLKFVGIAFAVLLFLLLFPWIVQLLWNGVLTDIVPVKEIGYWQAFGLLLLSKILFGGFPGGSGSKCCHDLRRRGPLHQEWDFSDPVERERCRAELRRHYCDEEGDRDSGRKTEPN